MARRNPREEITVQLDSFMDIITNAIGILIVVTVMAMINSSQMTFVFRTPFARKTEKAPLFFECRSGRVTFIDKADLQKQLDVRQKEIEEKKLPPLQVMDEVETKKYKVENDYYEVDVARFIDDKLLVMIPKKTQQGENGNELERKDSQIRAMVEKIDPNENFVFFLVRPDSFEAFRKIRKILWDKGVQVGWEPLTMGQHITFASKGRSAVID